MASVTQLHRILDLFVFSVWVLQIFNTDGCMRSKAVLKIICPSDIEVLAERRLVYADISWRRDDFSISSTYTIKGIYQMVPVYGSGADVKRIFYEGTHYVEYKVVDEGGNFDQCSFTITIRVIRCSVVYNPQFGVLTCTAGNLYASQCSISCIPGYSVSGAKTFDCLEDGQWSDDASYCKMITCPDPGIPLHGMRFCTTSAHTYGSICSFDCPQGYQVFGNNRLICGANGEWLASSPTCREIIPPIVEKCPSGIHLTTTGHFAEAEKPDIQFRMENGKEARHACSHFGDNRKHNFSLGIHIVTCIAYDPSFGDKAISKCEFNIRIKANPCQTLPEPSNGSLLCSRAHGGGSATYDTICHLFCHKGFTLARSDRGTNPSTGVYHCHQTGSWIPLNTVPSCVLPKRPLEIKLPSEVYYTSAACPVDPEHIYEIQSKFLSVLQSLIRQKTPCSLIPKDCIVEDTAVKCHATPSIVPLRPKRYLQYFGQRYDTRQPEMNVNRRGNVTYAFHLPIQFHFGTKISEFGGSWPDEYHQATNRLFLMFEHLESQLQNGFFDLHKRIDSVNMEPVNDSLTYTHIKAVCDIGYSFNETLLLCVSCGPGTHYLVSEDRCVLCLPGTYQNEQATFSCKLCPPGSTTVEEGATNVTQCIDVDECLSSPCLNSGECHNENNGYSCFCLPEYSGRQCEEHVYNCGVHLCLNGGTCIPDGPDNYTCGCRSSYFGDYCQFFTVNGGWSDWSEWSACSKSCDGGVKTRNRSCDSPFPSYGGMFCEDAPVEAMVCNLQSCPECKKLRRPYQGSLSCETNVTDDITLCKISCQNDYTFHVSVLPFYICGRSTSYLWPHESPDNPRAILPACTEKLKPDGIKYELNSMLSLECTSNEMKRSLTETVQKQAQEITMNLECLNEGSCSLNAPIISGCGHRQKRMIILNHEVNVMVSLTYPAANQLPHPGQRGATEYDRMNEQLLDFGAQLLKESEEGSLFIEYNGSKVILDSRQTSTFNTIICQHGTVPSEDGQYCVTCSPGSYYLILPQFCVLCEIGFFQPDPGQLECIPCSNGKVTYGRGATSLMECYMKGTPPPDIPEEQFNLQKPSSNGLTTALGILIGFILATGLICLCALVIQMKRNKKQKEYDPKLAGMKTRWVRHDHEHVHLCSATTTEEKA